MCPLRTAKLRLRVTALFVSTKNSAGLSEVVSAKLRSAAECQLALARER